MDIYPQEDNFLLPDAICSCGRRNLNRLVYEYYKRAVVAGEEVREEQIKRYLEIKNSNLRGLKKQNALDTLQEDGKDMIQERLREIFTELGINRDCCRMHVSGALRGRYLNLATDSKGKPTLVDVTFDPENYYDLNRIYEFLQQQGN